MFSSKSYRPELSVLRSSLRSVLAFALVLGLAAGPTSPLFAQAAATTPMMLHITILDGEDSLNNIRERTAREPIVQVEDENHKPVAGALLLFTIQNGSSGAGGTFNGLSTLSVTTDAEGKAVAHGLKPNPTEGSYTIAVTATLGALVATAVIHQSNIAGAGGAGAPGVPNAPGTPATPLTPVSPGVPVTPGVPGTPGIPGNPSVPVNPASPITPGVPGAPAAPTTPATPGTESPTPAGGGSTSSKIVRHGIRHIPKKVWITGTVVIVTGVVVGVVATRGNNPTTITPGTGTVTGP